MREAERGENYFKSHYNIFKSDFFLREEKSFLSNHATCVSAHITRMYTHTDTHLRRRRETSHGRSNSENSWKRHVDIEAALETTILHLDLGKFYFAEANSKAKMTKSRRKIAKLLLASATPTRRPTRRYIRYIRYVGRSRRQLVGGLKEEKEEGEKRSQGLSRFRDAFVGTSTRRPPRTSARSLGPGYIPVVGKSPIEFPATWRRGME